MKLFVASLAVIAASPQTLDMQAGNWETTVLLTDLTLSPTAPPEMEMGMRAALGGEGQTSQSCISQQEIEEAPQSIFGPGGDDCEYSEFRAENGMIRASAICDGSMSIEMDGTYTSTNYAMTVNVDGDMGEGLGPMTMQMSIEGQRLGECS